MKRAEALLLLTHYSTTNPAKLPCDARLQCREETPLLLCGLASISGAMEDAESWPALVEAIEHGRTLISAGIISYEEWEDEVRDITLATLEI